MVLRICAFDHRARETRYQAPSGLALFQNLVKSLKKHKLITIGSSFLPMLAGTVVVKTHFTLLGQRKDLSKFGYQW